MRGWSVLLLVLLLAGCFGGKTASKESQGASVDGFDMADLRLPHLPDGRVDVPLAGSAASPGFPVFGAAVVMNRTYGGHRETSLALGTTEPALRFACDPSGVPNTGAGHSWFYASRDNGTTFADVQVETSATDTRKYTFEGGDCDVAIGPDGTWWTADTWLGSLSVGKSTDNGQTWTGTGIAATSPVVDRPWLAVDGGSNLHVIYQDVQALMPSAIWYTHLVSQEGTLAFAPAVPVADASTDGAFTWEGNLATSPDGQDLWCVYTRRAAPVTSNLEGSGAETVWVAASMNGGLTWTQHKVSDRPAPASFLYPSIARDGLGALHVVFAQKMATGHPIFHSWSRDNGTTWSDPVAILDGVSGYSPWVAGAAHGGAAIQWFGSPNATADFNDNKTAWYTYWATATPSGAGYDHLAGTTSREPLYVGTIGETPEFNEVRLDADGRMHLGISIPVADDKGQFAYWDAKYQSQTAGPLLG